MRLNSEGTTINLTNSLFDQNEVSFEIKYTTQLYRIKTALS